MVRTRFAVKRQRTAVVESALANIDVVSQLAAFLEAKDLCQVKATCKALGSANDEAASNGLSMVEEVAKRVYEGATDEEKATLPRCDGESWIVLYHHLLMLQASLTFDQLIGRSVEYRGGDKAAVQGRSANGVVYNSLTIWRNSSQAICGNHIMRAGKHWVTFTSSSSFDDFQDVGVVRPLPGWDKGGLDGFSPAMRDLRVNLQRERTDKWEGDVHYCRLEMGDGDCFWSDWAGRYVEATDWIGSDDYDTDCRTLGMLLDLGEGTLSVYQNGRRLGTLKDGLAGEYCWIAGFWKGKGDVSIQKGYGLKSSFSSVD